MFNIDVFMRQPDGQLSRTTFSHAGYWVKDNLLFISQADQGKEIVTPWANVVWLMVTEEVESLIEAETSSGYNDEADADVESVDE